MKTFFVASFALLALACAPAPAVRVCPEIPTPAPVEMPTVVVPLPTATGTYCFTADEMKWLARGIQNLQRRVEADRALIEKYNKTNGGPK